MDNEPLPGEQPTPLAPPPDTRKANKILFLILVLLLIAAGSVLVTNNKDKSDPTPVISSVVVEPAEVAVTKDGFSPQTIQITVGQSVNWTNQDDAVHQIAADPHPTHTSLSSLVSSPIEKGESYAFPFEKAGTYSYHDELNPLKFNGTIIVK